MGRVDRELKLHHEPPHLRHRLLGVASAADHEIISIDHDLRAKPRLQTSPLPSQHKSPHVQIGEQWGDRSALRNPAARVPGGCRPCLPSSAVVFFNRRLQPHLDQMQQVPVRDPARHRLLRDDLDENGGGDLDFEAAAGSGVMIVADLQLCKFFRRRC